MCGTPLSRPIYKLLNFRTRRLKKVVRHLFKEIWLKKPPPTTKSEEGTNFN
jgi:hypothetical protein